MVKYITFFIEQILKYTQSLGRGVLRLMSFVGELAIFIAAIAKRLFKDKFELKIFFKQLAYIGFFSLPLVALTSIFTGAVLALQSYTGFSRFNAESAIASVVVLSITRELAPVLVGLMLSGRVCAAIAAEISSMKATDQLDALYTLGKNPISYLAVPRLFACMICLPILVVIADVLGVLGGYLTSVYKLGFSPTLYIKNTFHFLESFDVISGLIKAFCFGIILALFGNWFGFKASEGSLGVGLATTTAVVVSSITILIANYFITGILFVK